MIASCHEQLLMRLRRCQASSNYLSLQVCCSRQRVGWDFPIEHQTQFKIKQQVIASATITCTRMMSSILDSLTSTCPRVNAENEHGIQRIVGLLVFGNFFLTADKLILHHLLLRCYVDNSNTCSDSKFSTEGSPYNWSCQACKNGK